MEVINKESLVSVKKSHSFEPSNDTGDLKRKILHQFIPSKKMALPENSW